MKLSQAQLSRVWGWWPTGDFGPMTYYTSHLRQRTIGFLKAPPDKPPSWKQRVCRQNFRYVGTLWNALTPEQRQAWETAALRARLRISGINLFTYGHLTKDWSAVQTVQRQSGVDLGV